MDLEQFLEVRKGAVQRVCGVRDVKFLVALVGEQVGQVRGKASIGGPEPPVRVAPSARGGVGGALLEEPSPFLMPRREGRPEGLLAGTMTGAGSL